jgi:predicted nucleotidyltransferase
MMTRHEDLVKEAKEAIDRVFSDTSVPASQTREDMEELASDIDIMLDSLPKEEL